MNTITLQPQAEAASQAVSSSSVFATYHLLWYSNRLQRTSLINWPTPSFHTV